MDLLSVPPLQMGSFCYLIHRLAKYVLITFAIDKQWSYTWCNEVSIVFSDRIQGDHGGLTLDFVDFNYAVPRVCPLAMPSLPNFHRLRSKPNQIKSTKSSVKPHGHPVLMATYRDYLNSLSVHRPTSWTSSSPSRRSTTASTRSATWRSSSSSPTWSSTSRSPSKSSEWGSTHKNEYGNRAVKRSAQSSTGSLQCTCFLGIP